MKLCIIPLRLICRKFVEFGFEITCGVYTENIRNRDEEVDVEGGKITVR